jgi:hypothetical protein
MNFINNYSQAVTLAAGATSLPLSLPDGEYRLTLTDSELASTRWEIVGAVVVSGTATLQRSLEGTTDQPWPEGSVIYSALTAGLMQIIFQRLLPAGGTAGQLLSKLSETDFDVQWIDDPSLPSFGGAMSGRLFVAYLDSADSQRKAAVIDLATGTIEQSAPWMTAYTGAAIGPADYNQGNSLLAAFPNSSNKIQLFQGPAFTAGATSSAAGAGGGVAWKPDGSMLVGVTNGSGAVPMTYNAASTPALQLVLGGSGAISGVTPSVMPIWSPDGTYLYVPTGNGIQRRNSTTFALVDTVLDEQIFQFALSADGSNAAVRSYNAGTFEETIRIVETAGWTVLATFVAYSQVSVGGDMTQRMEFNPANSQQLAVAIEANIAGVDAACVILDVGSPGTQTVISPAADFNAGAFSGRQVVWSPNGDRLYVATNSGLHAYTAADFIYSGTLPSINSDSMVVLP